MKMVGDSPIARPFSKMLALFRAWQITNEADFRAIGIANREILVSVGALGGFAGRDALLLQRGGGAW